MAKFDTSIIAQDISPKFESRENMLAKQLQLQTVQQEYQKNAFEMQKGQADYEQGNKLAQYFRDNPNVDVNTAAGKSAIIGVGGIKRAQDYFKNSADVAKTKTESEKIGLENHVKKFDLLGQLMGGVNDQASYDIARMQATKIPELAELAPNMPPDYNPTRISQNMAQAMSVKDRMTQRLAELTQSETGRHNLATENETRANNIDQTRDRGLTRAQANDHYNLTRNDGLNAPQYMETDAGLVALPKRPMNGQAPMGTPVMSASGQPLGKPLKDIPVSVNTAMVQNQQSTGAIDRALTLLGGNSINGMTGDKNATGMKGYLPNGILNRIDPEGVSTRAEISDIGSLKIHDRSGAAVTISESPRLMPFIPLATDDAETVKKKLERLKVALVGESDAMSQIYSKEQGYKPSPLPANKQPAGKTIVKTGMSNGRKVVQYSDGSIDYAN